MASKSFESLAQYRVVRACELHAFFGVPAREIEETELFNFAALNGDTFVAREADAKTISTGAVSAGAAVKGISDFVTKTGEAPNTAAFIGAIDLLAKTSAPARRVLSDYMTRMCADRTAVYNGLHQHVRMRVVGVLRDDGSTYFPNIGSTFEFRGRGIFATTGIVSVYHSDGKDGGANFDAIISGVHVNVGDVAQFDHPFVYLKDNGDVVMSPMTAVVVSE